MMSRNKKGIKGNILGLRLKNLLNVCDIIFKGKPRWGQNVKISRVMMCMYEMSLKC